MQSVLIRSLFAITLFTPALLTPRAAVAQVDVNAMFDRAARYVEMGGLTRGREELKSILEVDPFWSDIYREIGYLSMELSEPVECVLYSERYLAMEPDADDAAQIRRRIDTCNRMVAETGTLHITHSVPERAAFAINGVGFGRGSAEPITLPVGTYTITAEAIDHEPYEQEVTVAVDETTSFGVELTPIIFQGQVTIISEVEGAEVRIDGALIGTTPIPEPIERDEGSYLIEITAEGYHPWRRNVEFVRDDNLPIDVRLIDESVDLSEFY